MTPPDSYIGNPPGPAPVAAKSRAAVAALTIAAVAGALAWSFWPVLVELFAQWQNDPNYSAGQLVPLVAIYLAWSLLRDRPPGAVRPCWWGAGLIVVGQLVRLGGLIFLYESLERYAFVLTVWGVVLLVAGWPIFWRLRWVLLFLLLMVPFPGKLHNLISGPLQGLATGITVYALELGGVVVERSGNLIQLNEQVTVGVVEACSGLRMLTAFIVVAATGAFLVERPAWQRTVLVLSSVPIAILCNAVRLLATTLLYMFTTARAAEVFFHDFAGLCMMPLALALLLAELWLLNRLVIPETTGRRNAIPAPSGA